MIVIVIIVIRIIVVVIIMCRSGIVRIGVIVIGEVFSSKIVKMIRNKPTMAVSKGEGQRHTLGRTECGDPVDHVLRHGEDSPAMANDGVTGAEVEKVMTSLTIACRSHADGASGAGVHGVVVIFVGLDVGPEFETNMMLKGDVVSLD